MCQGKSYIWNVGDIAGPEPAGFLLHPFRKPKRIRTAFSPSQLLKLEHAFEKNHYVVGAERKQLAQSLSLTETQAAAFSRVATDTCPFQRATPTRQSFAPRSQEVIDTRLGCARLKPEKKQGQGEKERKRSSPIVLPARNADSNERPNLCVFCNVRVSLSVPSRPDGVFHSVRGSGTVEAGSDIGTAEELVYHTAGSSKATVAQAAGRNRRRGPNKSKTARKRRRLGRCEQEVVN
ncbi:hypothetical protein HPB50_025385 [Hyalomma asiaticum]|uniref:Uncharacterized protein n=1 Tax=Hyalomma asiaticum TaxID=266040 RepID=A0ACB7TQK2_HYAAI|nr:hypothetical protein HPB50_025385 [Hyalomma asiaticum]